MAWTYGSYTGINYGIPIAIAALLFVVIFILFFTSKKAKKFIHDRIVGVHPDSMKDEDDETLPDEEGTQQHTSDQDGTQTNDLHKESSINNTPNQNNTPTKRS
ncbi:unnamed protein product, partial [Rotaria sp. Silwood1]